MFSWVIEQFLFKALTTQEAVSQVNFVSIIPFSSNFFFKLLLSSFYYIFTMIFPFFPGLSPAILFIYSYSVNWTHTRLFCNQPEQASGQACLNLPLAEFSKEKEIIIQKSIQKSIQFQIQKSYLFFFPFWEMEK